MFVTAFVFMSVYTSELEPLKSFSLRYNDTNFMLQTKQASDEIVFIAIDEQSVNRFGRWPWRRDVLAHAVDNLDSESLLVFDMVFSEPTPHDIRLADSIAEQDNSLCGFFLRHKATESLSEAQSELISNSSLERLSSALGDKIRFVEGAEAEVNVESILSSCTLSGTFSTLRDSDQLLRKYPIAFTFNGEILPSIGTQALRMLLNKDIFYEGTASYKINNHIITTDERGFSRINFYPLKSYNTHSFTELYDGTLSKDSLAGKIVILGLSEVGLGDIRVTPIGPIPGALVHYTFISNVLQDLLLHENVYLTVLSLLFFLLLPLVWILMQNIYKRALLYITTYILFFTITKLVYLYFNLYLDAFYPLIALLFSAIVSETLMYKKQDRQIRFVKHAFASYLSPQLLSKLIKDPQHLKLGGEKKELTIFFSDIRSFTSISEKMDAQKLTHYLNRYFTPMSDIVMKHNGMIDKYIGDALMAFYNAPVDVKEHAADACRTSLEMLEALERLNAQFYKEGLPSIEIGIGLNTTEVVVGNMGSQKRFNYTVIGDGVNLASRVEGLNKTFGTKILITEQTKAHIGDIFLTRPLEKFKVKGKEEEVMLYELLQDTAENREKVEKFTVALAFYKQQSYKEALQHFNDLLSNDRVCRYFIEKIDRVL
jgi:adenylate cyclase